MNPKVLIIGYVWPEPQSSAAGIRTWNLIETFLHSNWNLTFASSSNPNSFTDQLKSRGILTQSIQPNHLSFDAFIRELAPDLVIFDRFIIEEQFGWRVRECCPKAIRVIDTQDLHFLRRSREFEYSRGHLKDRENKLTSETVLRELASIYRSDGSLILSDYEYQLLIEHYNIPPQLLKLSRFHYPDMSSENSPSFECRDGFSIIGNFRHAPNLDGIRWFHSEVWPAIRSRFAARMKVNQDSQLLPKVFIYGAYPPKSIMELHDENSGFYVIGPVSDSIQTLRKHRVNLAPLRFGAGIKGKITDGWYAGTPVVTTPIGSEGMYSNLPWGGEIGTTVEEFASKAVDLYLNEGLWHIAQKNGFRLMSELYQTSKNEEALIRYFESLIQNRDVTRNQNLIGNILWHHTLQSTKYFSKWIEEKEKLKVPV